MLQPYEAVEVAAKLKARLSETAITELKRITGIGKAAFRADMPKNISINQQTDEEENGSETQADISIN